MKLALCAAGAVLLCGIAVVARPPAPAGAWTLGVYTGPSPFRLSPPPETTNPVLSGSDVTDMKVDTLAHPFLAVEDSRYYMFFTAKDKATDKGGIGLAESADGRKWTFRRTVVREPFVLSHPCVFKWRDTWYMIPEAHTETSVRLYRATEFPDTWKYEGDLLRDDRFISPTIVRFRNMWWLFVARSGNETLRLFFASELQGPWKEHPRSPIVEKDLNTARPAGRPLVIDGTLYRFGQDCYPTYGNQVHAFRITAISPTAYSERMLPDPVVKASAKGWNAAAMHHVDAHLIAPGRWLAAVDAQGE